MYPKKHRRPQYIVAERVRGIYGPIAESGARELGRYTIEQLHLLIDFHQRARALQESHLTRVRALRDADTAGRRV
jgi:hypothetical protein